LVHSVSKPKHIKTSWVWHFFEELKDDENKARCKLWPEDSPKVVVVKKAQRRRQNSNYFADYFESGNSESDSEIKGQTTIRKRKNDEGPSVTKKNKKDE
jgi:hypothetical protein